MRVKKKSRRQINDSKKQYMQQRRSRVSPIQYTKVKVRGDGNCLFRAISLGIYGTEEYHIAIRLGTVNYIADHWDRHCESIRGEYQRLHIYTKDQYTE